jgi:hypothetical protein
MVDRIELFLAVYPYSTTVCQKCTRVAPSEFRRGKIAGQKF